MTCVPAASHPSPPEHPERPDQAGSRVMPPWPTWAPLAALAAAFAAAAVAAIVFGLIGAVAGSSLTDPPPAVSIASVIAQDGCLIGAALLFARLSGSVPRPWQFGLEPVRRLWPAAGWVVAGYLGFILFSYVWLSLIGRTEDQDEIAEQLGAKDSTIALIGVTFVVTVCAPIAEELFFRGYTFGTLRRMGLWPAAALTGLLFGIVHVFGSPIAFIVPLAALGAVLCLVRERTSSLYPCMVLHCANNSFAMASSESWGWQIPVVLVSSLACIYLFVRLLLAYWPARAEGPRPPTPAPAAA